MASHEAKSAKKTLARLLAAVMIVTLIVSVFPAVALAAAANSSSITGTIPATMTTGQSYTVKITVKNTGTATWTAAAGYKLVCTAGAASFGNSTSIALATSVKPKGSVTFTVVMKAPKKVGKVTSAWRMSKGTAKFGATLTKKISVILPVNDSQISAASFPTTITQTPDTQPNVYKLSVTFKNTGSAKWTSKGKYSLIGMFTLVNPLIGTIPVNLSPVTLTTKDSIATGASKTFVIPDEDSVFPIDGVYTFSLQMACNGKGFGPVVTKKITVKFSADLAAQMAQGLIDEANSLIQDNDYKDAQTVLNFAKYYINQLPNGNDKSNLQNSLNETQAILDLPGQQAAAEAAVRAAYAKYKQADYSAANWTALRTAEAAGIANIESADTKAEVDTAKANAIAAMAAVKTKVQELAAEKTLAHGALNTELAKYSKGNYSISGWTVLNKAKTDGDTAINAATTIAGVDAARDAAKAAMAAVKTLAQELAAEKTSAHGALNTELAKYSQGNYSDPNWTALNKAKTDGDTAINSAATISDVDTARDDAIAAMAAVKTKAQTLDSITLDTTGAKLSYFVNDPLDISGLVVTGHYDDLSTKTETITAANVSGFDSSAAVTGQVLTVTVGGKTATYTVDIVEPTLDSITLDTTGAKLSYFVNDPLDISGLVVTGHYNDLSTKTETISAANVSGFDSSVAVTGQELTVTVGGKTATYNVDIVEPTLDSITLDTTGAKLSYFINDPLDISGLVVTGHYSDGSTKTETITTGDVSGFDSSDEATGQVLTVTVGGKTATYNVDIVEP